MTVATVPTCSHSACAQNYIDNESTECVEDPVMLAVEELPKDTLVNFMRMMVRTLYWELDVDDDGEEYEEWNIDMEWDSSTLSSIVEKLPKSIPDSILAAAAKKGK